MFAGVRLSIVRDGQQADVEAAKAIILHPYNLPARTASAASRTNTGPL